MPRAATSKAAQPASARPPKGRAQPSPVAPITEASAQYADRVALHERICDLISDGLSARAACAEIGVPMGRWMTWVHRGVVDGAQYARAMAARGHRLAEEVVEIADTDEDPQRAKVRVDARKWTAARMAPKQWGDRLDLTSDGEKLAPLGVVVLPVVTHAPPSAMREVAGPYLGAIEKPTNALQTLKGAVPKDLNWRDG